MMPLVPSGATLESVYSAFIRAGHFFSWQECLERVYGEAKYKDFQFGAQSAKIASVVFAGYKSASSVIAEHSFFPISAAMLPVDTHLQWWRELQYGSAALPASYTGTAGSRLLRSSGLRFCDECSQADIEKFGCAHWRVEHHVSFASHCAKHRLALMTHCRRCSAPIDRHSKLPKLPNDPCAACGNSSFIHGYDYPDTIAYRRALQFAAQELSNPTQQLRPLRRALLKHYAYGSLQNVQRGLIEAWGVSSLEILFERLGLRFSAGAGLALDNPYISRLSDVLELVLISYLSDNVDGSNLSEKEALSDPEIDQIIFAAVGDTNPSVLGRCLVRQAVLQGYPVRSAWQISSNALTRRARVGAYGDITKRFLLGLPKAIQIDLEMFDHLPPSVARIPRSPMFSQNKKRATVEKFVAKGFSQTELSRCSASLYGWMVANDHEWFESTVPRTNTRKPKTVEKASAKLPDIALKAIPGVFTPGHCSAIDRNVTHWLHTYDAQWLKTNILL